MIPGAATAPTRPIERDAPSLVISEVYGPTHQGEGPSTGRLAAFIRTGGCNLTCTWCDTPFTWDASRYDLRKEMTRTPVDKMAAQVVAMHPHVVIVTGGEPLLHQDQPGWPALLRLLGVARLPVEVETNGTVLPNPSSRTGVRLFVVSPKLAHSGDPQRARLRLGVLGEYAKLAHAGRAVMKVVCQTPRDVTATANLADKVGWPLRSVFVMPEGTTADAVLAGHRALAQPALDAGLGMSTRLHVLTWGDERAR